MIVFVWFCMKYIWPPMIAALEERKQKVADGIAAGERGQHELELAQSRDLDQLQANLGESARRKFMDRQGADHNQDNARTWEFGTLRETITTEKGIPAWPALVDQGDSVGVRLYDSYEDAWLAHHEGVYRLLLLDLPDKLKYLEKHHAR